MKTIQALTLTLLTIFYGLPVITVAQNASEIFALPMGFTGDAYRANVEEILRSTYGLRIDTGAQSSILQWYYVNGEMPPGITIRTDGTMDGAPSASAPEPYRFTVKVLDVATNSAALFIDLSIRVEARIKLTKISQPRLVPISASVPVGMNTAMERAVNESGRSVPFVAPYLPSATTTYEPALFAVERPAGRASFAPYDDSSAVSGLWHRSKGGKVPVTINTPATSVPKPVEVKNGTEVTITGTKRPVDTCAVATKREELKPEPNPLAQLMKVIIGFGAFGVADVDVASDLCPGDPPGNEVPNDPEAIQVEREIASIRESLFDNIQKIGQAHTEYQGMAKRIKNFASCKDVDGTTDICTPAQFDGTKDSLKADVTVLLSKNLPAIESTDLQLATLKKVLADRYKKPVDERVADLNKRWLEKVNKRLDCFSQNMEPIKKDRELLLTAKADLEKFQDLLDAHATKFEYAQVLLADSNAKVSGTVTCTNFFTKQVTVEAIPFVVTYQDMPRATVSAGVLFSLLDRRQIGTQPVRTGTAADGTPTFVLSFVETERSSSQVVPFSFFNYYLTGTRKLNLNLSGGLGLNPNNGSNQVEYFLGGALGIKNMYLQFGGHVGRWQELGQGFVIGDTVPDKFPAAVPLERRYSIRPAFGVSYKLPLP